MLIEALTDHFQSYFNRAEHHDTVLWFDAGQEYAALLDHLANLPLWRYNGSLLELRYRLINRAPGERAVVYLPLRQGQAEILRPFFGTGFIFRDRLYRFLRHQGLDFPDDPEVAHELRALLPRLAARSIGKGRSFWEYNLANLERARETLLGNFDDALLRFLAQPQITLAELKGEKLDGLFFAQLEGAYGLAADSDDNPDEVARRLTAQFALVRAFTDAGQPHGFPFAAQLPDPLYHERSQAFLDRWQRDSTYKTAYIRLADALETRYDLAGWVARLPLSKALDLGPTFADVEKALWAEAEAGMSRLESEDDWCNWLEEYQTQLDARSDSFWAREGRAPGWGLLARAASLLSAVRGVQGELDRLATPAALLRRYADTWWRIDHDFRVLGEKFNVPSGSYDLLCDRCVRSYRDILRRMNDRFSTLLATEDVWPAQALPAQDEFWKQIAPASRPQRKVAVMFVDALRYELGRALHVALGQDTAGDERRIGPRLAAIPTVTPIGMAALLPDGDRRRVAYDQGWVVTIDDSGNLKDKAARRQWLQQNLDDVVFYNLGDLLDMPAGRIPEASVYIVFDTTLDAVGETASTIAWNTFSILLRSVKKGVHKLLALGVSEVHVVADHGFLLLDEVGEHEKAGARSVSALIRKSRYVVGPRLPATDQLRFSVPGSDDLVAWFPRGIGCFRTPGPYNYVHGGLSLQELVIPHLTVVQQVMGRPVGVQAELPDVIRNAQFKIPLRPVTTSVFDQPRQVSLSLEKAGELVIPPLSRIVAPGEPTTLDVFLPMGCGLEPGDGVRWLLHDAVTDEVLVEQEATSEVDLW